MRITMPQIQRKIKQLVDNLVTQEGYKFDAYTYTVRIEFDRLIVDVDPLPSKKERNLK